MFIVWSYYSVSSSESLSIPKKLYTISNFLSFLYVGNSDFDLNKTLFLQIFVMINSVAK